MTREERFKMDMIDEFKLMCEIVGNNGRIIVNKYRMLKALEQEPRKGHWEYVGDNCFRCTQCGEIYTFNQFDAINNYCDNRFPKGCPNCGADMREVEK